MKCFAFILFVIAVIMRPTAALRCSPRLSLKVRPDPKVIVVVGGGAAGYFSAVECARTLQERKVPYKVMVFEAGRTVLSKVLISGGGRCNVMHNPEKAPGDIANGYPRGSKELLGPLSAKFGPQDTHEWFTSRGVALKTEKDGRVFPTTDRSSTIADTLEAAARSAEVQVVSGAKVIRLDSIQASQDAPAGKRFTVTYQTSKAAPSGGAGGGGAVLRSKRSSLYEGLESLFSADSDDVKEGEGVKDSGGASEGAVVPRTEKVTHTIDCDRVIVATGSSRLGYDMVRAQGHSMHDPLPSLFSFKIPDADLTALSGLSTKYAKVRLVVAKEAGPATTAPSSPSTETSSETHEAPQVAAATKSKGKNKGGTRASSAAAAVPGLVQRGPLLLTRQGMSGPAVLKLSAFGARIMNSTNYKFDVEVSWVGDLTAQQLTEHFVNEKKFHPNRLLSKCFPHLTEELLAEMKERMAASMLGQNARREDIGYRRYMEEVGNTGEEEADMSIYDVPEQQRLAASAEGEDNVVPRRLWLYLLRRQGLEQQKWGQVSTRALQGLAHEVTKGVYGVQGRGLYRDEFVTCGGVNLKEVQFNTMESRVRAGMYLAGEVLDVDGITGGYNFQSAWTTGYLAGSSCARSLLPDHERDL